MLQNWAGMLEITCIYDSHVGFLKFHFKENFLGGSRLVFSHKHTQNKISINFLKSNFLSFRFYNLRVF